MRSVFSSAPFTYKCLIQCVFINWDGLSLAQPFASFPPLLFLEKAVWSLSSSEVAPWSFCHKDTHTKSTAGGLYRRRKGKGEPGQLSAPGCGLSHAFKRATIARTSVPHHSCSEEMFLIQTRKITPGLCMKYSWLPFNPGGTSTAADYAQGIGISLLARRPQKLLGP